MHENLEGYLLLKLFNHILVDSFAEVLNCPPFRWEDYMIIMIRIHPFRLRVYASQDIPKSSPAGHQDSWKMNRNWLLFLQVEDVDAFPVFLRKISFPRTNCIRDASFKISRYKIMSKGKYFPKTFEHICLW